MVAVVQDEDYMKDKGQMMGMSLDVKKRIFIGSSRPQNKREVTTKFNNFKTQRTRRQNTVLLQINEPIIFKCYLRSTINICMQAIYMNSYVINMGI